MTRTRLLRLILSLTATRTDPPFPTVYRLCEEALLSDWKASRGTR